MADFYPQPEISVLGECLARCYLADLGRDVFPIEPEIIATKYFGLNIHPQHQLSSIGVRSGIDTSQSIIFIDHDTYMMDELQPYARQGIAHELGHAIFDGPLIRQLAGTSADDAYELHDLLLSKHPGIEARANMLSGALLVPRSYMLKRVAMMLAQNYERVIELYPEITIGTVFEQMASSQLSRHFGVSDEVVAWRFKNEALHDDFRAAPESLLSSLDFKLVSQLAGMEYRATPLSDKLKALLPEDMLLTYRKQWA